MSLNYFVIDLYLSIISLELALSAVAHVLWPYLITKTKCGLFLAAEVSPFLLYLAWN